MSTLHDQINYWAAHAGRPITKFEQLMLARPFKYSSYWRTWSRILKPVWAGTPLGIVEVSLSVPPGALQKTSAEDALREMRIRSHLTTADKSDKFSSSLPEDVRQELITIMGSAEDAQYMMYGNIWEHIDWDKYNQAKRHSMGGGIPLAHCHVNGNEAQTLQKE